jgi:hypothetical protein
MADPSVGIHIGKNGSLSPSEKGGSSSFLGEIWFSEADSLLGPWLRATKVVTHHRYSFYNPVHHPFFDQQEGRLIYFEGTYTNAFSGTKEKTPRYDYNQIMYRLDLSDPRLRLDSSPRSINDAAAAAASQNFRSN